MCLIFEQWDSAFPKTRASQVAECGGDPARVLGLGWALGCAAAGAEVLLAEDYATLNFAKIHLRLVGSRGIAARSLTGAREPCVYCNLVMGLLSALPTSHFASKLRHGYEAHLSKIYSSDSYYTCNNWMNETELNLHFAKFDLYFV